ncbi:MAG: hypothetical protein MMC23_007597 [Stictis urceolatum]|nr:hypothetical protein [Stictis urceolata]
MDATSGEENSPAQELAELLKRLLQWSTDLHLLISRNAERFAKIEEQCIEVDRYVFSEEEKELFSYLKVMERWPDVVGGTQQDLYTGLRGSLVRVEKQKQEAEENLHAIVREPSMDENDSLILRDLRQRLKNVQDDYLMLRQEMEFQYALQGNEINTEVLDNPFTVTTLFDEHACRTNIKSASQYTISHWIRYSAVYDRDHFPWLRIDEIAAIIERQEALEDFVHTLGELELPQQEQIRNRSTHDEINEGDPLTNLKLAWNGPEQAKAKYSHWRDKAKLASFGGAGRRQAILPPEGYPVKLIDEVKLLCMQEIEQQRKSGHPPDTIQQRQHTSDTDEDVPDTSRQASQSGRPVFVSDEADDVLIESARTGARNNATEDPRPTSDRIGSPHEQGKRVNLHLNETARALEETTNDYVQERAIRGNYEATLRQVNKDLEASQNELKRCKREGYVGGIARDSARRPRQQNTGEDRDETIRRLERENQRMERRNDRLERENHKMEKQLKATLAKSQDAQDFAEMCKENEQAPKARDLIRAKNKLQAQLDSRQTELWAKENDLLNAQLVSRRDQERNESFVVRFKELERAIDGTMGDLAKAKTYLPPVRTRVANEVVLAAKTDAILTAMQDMKNSMRWESSVA